MKIGYKFKSVQCMKCIVTNIFEIESEQGIIDETQSANSAVFKNNNNRIPHWYKMNFNWFIQ